MIANLKIKGDGKIGSILRVSYEVRDPNLAEVRFQWYIDGEMIQGATGKYLTSFQEGIYTVEALPINTSGANTEMLVSSGFEVLEEVLENPIEKEYLIKLYDANLTFLKVIPLSILTNDIAFSSSINAGQGELILNLNLPIDTDYFEGVKYIKVFASDTAGMENQLIYSGYLSKYSRIYASNRENIQANFLSLFSLCNEIYFKQGEETTFTKSGDPAVLIKEIIDQVSTFYPNLFSYTAESIKNYGSSIDLEVKEKKCGDLIREIVGGTNYWFYLGVDGIFHYQPKPSEISHYFTYEKDIKSLTIPVDFEQVVNAVRVQYGYIGGPHSGITKFAENKESISKYGRREATIVNQSLYGEASANLYRDQYLYQNSKSKQNISLTVNNRYPLETLKPGDLIKVRNLGVEVVGLQISSVSYQYDQAVLKLEYTTSIGQELLSPKS